MRRSRSSALVLLALAGAAAAAGAQAPADVSGAAFLLLPVGARTTALGQASAADGGTTEALFGNPAGLAPIRRGEAGIHHYNAFFGHADALALAVPVNGMGAFGLTAYIVDYGDLEVTPPGGGQGPIGQVSPRNLTLQVAFATEVADGIATGIAYKLVQFRVDCSGDCRQVPTAVGTTHAVDVGVQWAVRSATPLVIGVAVRHLGFPLQVNNQAQADPLPTRLVVGVRWQLVRPPQGIDALDLAVLADVQGSLAGDGVNPAPLVGLESGVRDLVRLRFGYAFVDTEASGPSLGLGVRVGRLGLDLARTFYATDAVGESEPVHLSLRFAL